MTSQFPYDILMYASVNPSYYELNMYFISSFTLSLSLIFNFNFLYLSLSILFFGVQQFNPILTDKLNTWVSVECVRNINCHAENGTLKIEYIQILFIVSYLRNIVIYDTKSVTSYGLLLQIFLQVLYFLFYDPRMHQSFTFHYL